VQAAELSIANAEQARVVDAASPELTEARQKLTAARAALEEKPIVAERLAEQAKVDAELAVANADVAKAKLVNDDMQKSNNFLNQEMQRNMGDQQ
jgi:hypothetical protein